MTRRRMPKELPDMTDQELIMYAVHVAYESAPHMLSPFENQIRKELESRVQEQVDIQKGFERDGRQGE